MTKAICEDNNGTWWGVGAGPGSVIKGDLEQCWQVNQVIFHLDGITDASDLQIIQDNPGTLCFTVSP